MVMEKEKKEEKQGPTANSNKRLREAKGENENEGCDSRIRPMSSSAYQNAYRPVRYSSIPSTGRPGTPHRYFAESYTLQLNDDHDCDNHPTPSSVDGSGSSDHKSKGDDNNRARMMMEAQPSTASKNLVHQVIHKHANGLAIVTVGNILKKSGISLDDDYDDKNSEIASVTVQSIEFKRQPVASHQSSAGSKRKQQARMLKGKQVLGTGREGGGGGGIVKPTDVLAVLNVVVASSGSSTTTGGGRGDAGERKAKTLQLPVHAGVWGTILEINHTLLRPMSDSGSICCSGGSTSSLARTGLQLLSEDPLLDGYLAIILPTGPFPPEQKVQEPTKLDADPK
jgi:hypothetical protein